MKLAYFRTGNDNRWGAVDSERQTIREVGGRFEEWAPEVTRKGSRVLDLVGKPIALGDVKLLPPLIPTAEIIGSGINYSTWALPPKGVDTCFEFKSHSAFIGTDDIQMFPEMMFERTQCTYRYELELGLIIGMTIEGPVDDGIKHVLGYTVVNDGCLRNQRPNCLAFDWNGSKCGYHASAAGPWIVTRDEFGDTQPDLRMVTRVDGVITQDGRTSNMLWDINRLLRELGARMEVRPGDLLFTGTPGYIGLPDGVTQPGISMEFEIERVGCLRTRMEDRALPVAANTTAVQLDFNSLLARARDWDGDSVVSLKPILTSLLQLDPKNERRWQDDLHGHLRERNAHMWPPTRSEKLDFWAVDAAYMRLYTERGSTELQVVGYVPGRDASGTP